MPTPNMNLPIPGVSITAGPQYASLNNSCFTLIDSHNHSSGSGVQINPDGININSDLPFNENNATEFRSVRFSSRMAPISDPADLGCLYESGVDLYFNDGNGNQVRITQSGGVAGSPGSIANLTSPASASYVALSTKFVWESDASESAAMDNGAITIRETAVASSKGITISAPAALAADYALTLMAALPGQQNVMTVDNSGNISNVTWNAVGTNMTSSGANAIAASRTRATGTTVGAGGVAISSANASQISSSASYVDCTSLTVTITTSGRPVFISLIPDGTIGGAGSAVGGTGSGTVESFFKIVRDSTDIAELHELSAGTSTLALPPGFVVTVDAVAAGTYTYKVQMKRGSAGTTAFVSLIKLIAYEL